ncbi:MAG: RloB domain-containing protein [Lacibacter sp.]|jgi:hypothetical protein
MSKRTTHYSILIVCEGENTEPKYFESIYTKIIEEGIWGDKFNVVIIPKPKVEEVEETKTSKHKSKRKERHILDDDIPMRPVIEDEYRTQPMSFVREAQVEMQDGSYDEAWAVFDYDHRKFEFINKAFELAKSEELGVVRIAYSSVAIEHWFLLHFERNTTDFQKSECRIGRDHLNCNSGEHDQDCYGARCVGGYLRNRKYLNISTKGSISLFTFLEPFLNKAYVNASWLRHLIISRNPKAPLFNLNPYTDVDLLVKYLLKKHTHIVWMDLNKAFSKRHYKMTANIDNSIISLTILNQSKTAQIINANEILIVDDLLNELYFLNERYRLEPDQNILIQIDLNTLQNPEFLIFKFDANEHIYLKLT